MAAIFVVTVYGAKTNDFKAGVSMGFPPSQCVFQTIAPTKFAGVTCNSQITLLPTAPSPIQPVYYVSQTVAALQTLANA